MNSTRGWFETGCLTERTRYVGAVHLVLAGAVNVLVAVALYTSLSTESAFRFAFAALGTAFTGTQLLERADLLALVLGTVAPIVAVALLLVGGVQVCAGLAAAAGRYHSIAVGSAVVGMVSGIAAPFGAIAAVLLWWCRPQFRDSLPAFLHASIKR